MGASNNKPLKNNAPPNRRRKYISKWRKRNETTVNDLTNNQYGSYQDLQLGNNFQGNDYNHTPFSDNQPYYNEQPNSNVSSDGYSYLQGTYTNYDEERPIPHLSSDGQATNFDADQSYSNFVDDASDSARNFSTGQYGEEYGVRPDTFNYNYNMNRPIRPLVRRRHSLNDDIERPSRFYQNNNGFQVRTYSQCNINDRTYDRAYQINNGFQVQSYSLNNLNDRMYYDRNTFQNGNWGSRQRINASMWRSNSVNGIAEMGSAIRGGKKRNSLDEDFYGEDFSSSALPDQYWDQGDGAGNNVDVSYTGPKVKRRQPNDSSEEYYSGRNDSAPPSRNNTPTGNYYGADFTQDDWNSKSHQFEDQSNTINILQFPSEWSCSLTNTGLVDIKSSSPEGEKLRRYFHKSSRSSNFQLCILGMTRIENPFLHTMFLLKKEEMMLRNGHVDELHLFHGTKQINVQQICENNLNWRMFSEKHKFGKGVSFSPLATYSSHYCDDTEIKVMLLFKVLVSNAVVGTSEMDIPPIIEDIAYDTSIKEDISVIVKYSDNEFYPLYKIMFTKRRV